MQWPDGPSKRPGSQRVSVDIVRQPPVSVAWLSLSLSLPLCLCLQFIRLEECPSVLEEGPLGEGQCCVLPVLANCKALEWTRSSIKMKTNSHVHEN